MATHDAMAIDIDGSREGWQRRVDDARAAILRWGPGAPIMQTRMLQQCLQRAVIAVAVHDALRSAKVSRDVRSAIRDLLVHEMRAWSVDMDWWGREGRCCAWSAVTKTPPAVLNAEQLADLEKRVKEQTGAGRHGRHRHRHRGRRSHGLDRHVINAVILQTRADACGRTASSLQTSWEGLKRYASSRTGMDVQRCMQRGECSSIASRMARIASLPLTINAGSASRGVR